VLEILRDSIDFSGSLEFVNRTRRFVVPVGNLLEDSEPLVYPPSHENAGRSLRDQRSTASSRGVVFYNGVDHAWQAVRSDGSESIVINEVSERQADQLKQRCDALREEGILSLRSIRLLLDYSKQELGLVDVYHTRNKSAEQAMKMISDKNEYYKLVTKPDLHRAVFVDTAFRFRGPVIHQYEQDGIIVTDGRYCWGVATPVFMRNFKIWASGQEQDIDSLSRLLHYKAR
jgi:hypothetical protein